MRTPFRWTRPSQTFLHVLYVCCALWGASTAALAEQDQITPTPVVSTSAPAAATVANNNTTRIGSLVFDRRVLTLLAMGCLIGMIAGWVSRDPREPRVRLLNKPKKTVLSILVPPGPAPRLIPGDCPNATRPRSTRAPVPRQTPVGAARPRVIDYIAAFADPAHASEAGRVDYLLFSGDNVEEALDPPDDDGSRPET
jgi:hypothetical protein